MTMDKWVLILLGVWAILFGIFAVTNLQVAWGQPLMGFAALALGVLCLIRAMRQ